MSEFVDELRALLEERPPQPHQKTCTVSLILADLTGEQRDLLLVLLEDGCRVPSGKVADTLRKWGYNVNYNAVQRHRRRHRGTGCLCP